MQTLTLDIAGHQITVRSAAEAAYVEDLARGIDERVRQARAQGAGPIASVLLSALALADELQRTRQRLAAAVERVGRHSEALRSAANAAEHD